MLIKDEAKLGQHATMRRREDQRAMLSQSLNRLVREAQFVDDPDIAPLDTMKKMGRIMMTPDFERRLKLCIPNLVFIGRRGFPGRKARCVMPGGESIDVGPYHADWLPERTIREPQVEYVPYDRTALSDIGAPLMRIELDRRPRRAWVPIEDPEIAEYVGLSVAQMKDLWEPNGQGAGQWIDLEPDDSYKGRKVVTAGKIKRRGWRGMLVMCIRQGLMTATAAEQNFGNDNTVEWKQHLGRGPMVVSW